MKINLSDIEKKYFEEKISLSEAEPYIKKFKKKIFLIKYGGNALTDKYLANNFAKDVVIIKKLGIYPVIVHGGGPQIDETLKKNNIKSKFLDGLRVTDAKTIKIVEKVLVSRINKKIVSLLNNAGGNAIGLPGNKNDFIKVKKIKKELGFVGKPIKIKKKIIKECQKKNLIPVVAPLGLGKDGNTYNINADIVAGELAANLGTLRFYFLTNIKGVVNKKKKLITQINTAKAKELIKKKIIKGGMIPKVKTCLRAIKKSAQAAVILDGRVPHSLLIEIFTRRGLGTLIGRK